MSKDSLPIIPENFDIVLGWCHSVNWDHEKEQKKFAKIQDEQYQANRDARVKLEQQEKIRLLEEARLEKESILAKIS